MSKTIKGIIAIVLILTVLVFAGIVMNKASKQIEHWSYPIEFEETVLEKSKEYSVPPSVIFAVIKTESSFNPDAESYIGARGLMQLTEETFDWMNLYCGKSAENFNCMYDAETNIDYGVWLLSYLYDKFGDWDTVYAAYHAGFNIVGKWLENPEYSLDGKTLDNIPYVDTANYVEKVHSTRNGYKAVYDFD